jgi:hypothetical protein
VFRKKARILLASVEAAHIRLAAILAGHELTFVTTLTDAQAALDTHNFDLVMIGTQFDESKVFDLLRCVRANGKYSGVPVICFRGVKFAAAEGKFMLRTIEMACREMGASCFFDLPAFVNDKLGNAKVRSIIRRVVERDDIL